MQHRNWVRGVVGALAAAMVFVGATANAQHRVGFQGMFGLGGEYEFKGGGEDDAEATVGFGLFYEYELFRYFDLGMNVHFAWTNSELADDAGIDRSTVIDFAPFLKAQYPLFGGRGEIYGKLPIGLAIGIPSDDLDNQETGVGLSVSFLTGFLYRFYGNLGAHIEMGWIGRYLSGDVKGGGEWEADVNQFALNLGVNYSF